MAEKKEPEEKICPLLTKQLGIFAPCIRERCALFVNLIKPSSDPAYMLHYAGCGLIINLPWKWVPYATRAEGEKSSA